MYKYNCESLTSVSVKCSFSQVQILHSCVITSAGCQFWSACWPWQASQSWVPLPRVHQGVWQTPSGIPWLLWLPPHCSRPSAGPGSTFSGSAEPQGEVLWVSLTRWGWHLCWQSWSVRRRTHTSPMLHVVMHTYTYTCIIDSTPYYTHVYKYNYIYMHVALTGKQIE